MGDDISDKDGRVPPRPRRSERDPTVGGLPGRSGPPRPRRRKGQLPLRPGHDVVTPPGKALVAVVAFALLALLLNVETLARFADRQPPSWRRDVAVSVLDAATPLAEALHLPALKAAASDARRWMHPSSPARVLHPTTDGGLTVLIAGDSVMEDLSGALADRLSANFDAASVVLTMRGMPLGLPELFDWPSEIRTQVEVHGVDLVLIGLPATPYGDGSMRPGDRGYEKGYAALVSEVLDAASASGAQVIWVERPITTDAHIEAERAVSRPIILDAVAATPRAGFIDLNSALAPDGRFTRSLVIDGRQVVLRTPDGIHLTPAGAALAAEHLVEVLADMTPNSGLGEEVIR